MGAPRLNLLHKHEEAHDDALWCTTWVPNQSQCITGSVDECVKVWSVQDEAPAVENSHTYTSHTLGVVSVTVDPTGTFAASSALDSFIRVWNLQVRRGSLSHGGATSLVFKRWHLRDEACTCATVSIADNEHFVSAVFCTLSAGL